MVPHSGNTRLPLFSRSSSHGYAPGSRCRAYQARLKAPQAIGLPTANRRTALKCQHNDNAHRLGCLYTILTVILVTQTKTKLGCTRALDGALLANEPPVGPASVPCFLMMTGIAAVTARSGCRNPLRCQSSGTFCLRFVDSPSSSVFGASFPQSATLPLAPWGASLAQIYWLLSFRVAVHQFCQAARSLSTSPVTGFQLHVEWWP